MLPLSSLMLGRALQTLHGAIDKYNDLQEHSKCRCPVRPCRDSGMEYTISVLGGVGSLGNGRKKA